MKYADRGFALFLALVAGTAGAQSASAQTQIGLDLVELAACATLFQVDYDIGRRGNSLGDEFRARRPYVDRNDQRQIAEFNALVGAQREMVAFRKTMDQYIEVCMTGKFQAADAANVCSSVHDDLGKYLSQSGFCSLMRRNNNVAQNDAGAPAIAASVSTSPPANLPPGEKAANDLESGGLNDRELAKLANGISAPEQPELLSFGDLGLAVALPDYPVGEFLPDPAGE